MTRETKIGLLVGLAFIIVIGILLSDHLTSSTEPPQAPLPQIGVNVRNGVATPGSNNPPITTVVVPPTTVAPQVPVPLNEDLTPRQPVIEVVRVDETAQQPAPVEPRLTTEIRATEPAVTHTPIHSAITQVAQQHGEQLVPVSHNSTRTAVQQPEPPLTRTAVISNPPANPAGPREYKAQENDTLSKMAGRFLGSNSKANRDAIVRLNPSLQQNPDRVIVGRTYLIPAVGTTSVAITDAPEVQLARDTVAPAPVNTRSAQAEYWYTVKPNDSLWKIAHEQLGDAGALNAIIELNKDILKGSTTVHPDMKLRLPTKPVASID